MNALKTRPGTAPSGTPARYDNDRARWRAVRARDPRADGAFVYSVQTTGVYCRPACAARRARRENVRFHDSWAAAERAGFRACRRCHPRDPAGAGPHAAAVAAACRAIESAEAAPSLAALAREAGLSRFHFHRVFKRLTGLTPKAYAAGRRAERTRRELGRRHTVTEALYEAGFNSNSRFYAQAGRMLGMPPKRFREGGAGETIRFAIGRCTLGAVLVAASARGVCAISLGDDPDRVARELRGLFPRARLVSGDENFARTVAAVIGLVETPALGLSLPLDVRGTAFQRRVWQALGKIPAGATASYSQVARRLGLPRGARAVARACAANTLAVAIPCHRVVRAGGKLAGYRWGLKRKQLLLERERRRALTTD